MGAKTKIEWCDHTFNPWRGCEKISTGCQHCYAETLAGRFEKGLWGKGSARRLASAKAAGEPLAWDRKADKAGVRRRVFCMSMGDFFEDRPDLDRARAETFDLISRTNNLDWMLLTKRPEAVETIVRRLRPFLQWEDQEDDLDPLRLPNVWLGTSVEDQTTADARIPELLRLPAAVRFVSCEPLLGPIRFPYGTFSGCMFCCNKDRCGDGCSHHFRPECPVCRGSGHGPHIDWVIVGGESGPRARPCNVAWIHSIVEQCQDAGVPCFVKQLGAKPTELHEPSAAARANGWEIKVLPIYLHDPKGGDPSEWHEDLRVRQFPGAVAAH